MGLKGKIQWVRRTTYYLLLIGVIFLVFKFLSNENYIERFKTLELNQWIGFSALAWLTMILTSIILFKVRLRNKVFKKKEVIFYPLMQSFWGYILPVQGSIIFSSFYFKKHHGVSVAKTVSINFFFLFISFTLAGFFGLIFNLYNNIRLFEINLLFLGMMCIGLSPMFYNMLSLNTSEFFKSCWVNKIFSFGHNLLTDCLQSFLFLKKNPFILLLYLLRLVVVISFYFCISLALDTGAGLLPIIILYFFLESSLIFKLTPGNWGVQQLVAAVIFSSVNLNPEDGVAIGTIATLSVMLPSFTIGFLSSIHMLHSLRIKSWKDLTNIFNS